MEKILLDNLTDKEIINKLQYYLGLYPTGSIDYKTKERFKDWKIKNNLSELNYLGDYSFSLLKKQANNIKIFLIKEFESFSSIAYPDPLHGWSIPTIGYGTTVYSNGRKVLKGDKITKELAELELILYVDKKIIPILCQNIPYWDNMNIYQHSSLISFSYNLGENFYGNTKFTTISKYLKEKNWDLIPEALLLYRNPGTSVESGLKRRRKAEGNLWIKGLREKNL